MLQNATKNSMKSTKLLEVLENLVETFPECEEAQELIRKLS